MEVYPLVNVYITNWKDPLFYSWVNPLEMAIFNSYVRLIGGLEHEFYDFPFSWECHHPN